MVALNGSHLSRIAAALAVAGIGAAGMAPRASAASDGMPELSVFASARPVSDAQMSQMRGRFVMAGQVVQFGVQMVSSWASPGGETLTAGALTDVSFNSAGVPNVRFTPHLTISQSATPPRWGGGPGGALTATGNGIANVRGVGQSVQVAGNFNDAGNSATISIGTEPIQGPNVPGGSSNGGTSTLVGPAGATVSSSLGGGAMNVNVSVPGVGRAMQTLGPDSFIQEVQVSGNLQQVRNMTSIEIQLATLNSLRKLTNMNAVLGLLHQLPR